MVRQQVTESFSDRISQLGWSPAIAHGYYEIDPCGYWEMTKKRRPRLLKDAKTLAMLIAIAVRNEIEDFHCEHLTDSQMQELNPK